MSENVWQTSEGRLQLSGMVNVDTVAEYRASLVEKITASQSSEVEVELSEIEMQGSAVIALLISVLREARSLDKTVLFLNCSEKLRAIASACGVDGILQIK
jgi:ABC-type transporter Mla MlaB component